MREIEAGIYTGASIRTRHWITWSKGVMTPYLILAIALFVFGYYHPLFRVARLGSGHCQQAFGRRWKLKKNTLCNTLPLMPPGVLAMFFHIGTQMVALSTQQFNMPAPWAKVWRVLPKNIPSYTMLLDFLGLFHRHCFDPEILKNKEMRLLICATINLILFDTHSYYFRHSYFFSGITADISLWYLVMMGLPNALLLRRNLASCHQRIRQIHQSRLLHFWSWHFAEVHLCPWFTMR